ncbi:hypothetical protein D9758_001673 [Tetrapyrgos nigripes]|uniref:Uncharacterized protein n=1 Tax=Tetrapyrgos nigripes TaxID=182062 RepID=A0A8H5GXZ4_9AGAR|nr:hypothetical protein D9758_001673 [Tetrapyrgos nigripes]
MPCLDVEEHDGKPKTTTQSTVIIVQTSLSIQKSKQKPQKGTSYAALGLIHDLNPTESGGTEISIDIMGNTDSSSGLIGVCGETATVPSSFNLSCASETSTGSSFRSRTGTSNASAGPRANSTKTTSIPAGYGKIIRDENGHIIDVQLAEEPEGEDSTPASVGDVDMEQLSPELDESIREKWTDLGGKNRALGGTDSTVVKAIPGQEDAGAGTLRGATPVT